MISGRTAYYGIFGKPIEQALSPIIHNAAFEALGIDAVFLGHEIQEDGLADAVRGARALGYSGLAVTMPYKRTIIPLLDEVQGHASVLGAVNVVQIKDGRMIGYNTDGDGFVASLKAGGVEPAGKTVFLFGAGGAARGIALALFDAGIKQLFICNIYEDEAQSAIQMLKGAGYEDVSFVPFERTAAVQETAKAEIIINATNLGMKGNSSEHMELIDWDHVGAETAFADIVHSPLTTPLLEKAQKLGHKTVKGDGMLLYQGMLAFQIYTGMEPPEQAMRTRLDQWLTLRKET